MAKSTPDIPSKGGFSYDLCKRNAMLSKTGVQLPPFTKTGTTIVGLIFKDGVILGADTRATSGSIVLSTNITPLEKLVEVTEVGEAMEE